MVPSWRGRMLRRLLLGFLGTWMIWSPASAQELPRDDPFPAQVQKLTPGHTREVRLEALDWMIHNCYRPTAVRSMPAVERCLKQDPDPEVRAKAVEVLGMMAYQHQPRVCPLAVVEALLDPDVDVRNIAMGCSGMYREFAPGTREVLLKAARHEAPGVRSHALLLLAEVAPRDAEVNRVIRAGLNDKDFEVRCDAHFALFRITDQLEDVLPYYLRVTAEVRAEPSPRTEAEKQERARKVLRCLGTLNLLSDLGEKRPDELAKFFLEMLKEPSPALRQGALIILADLAGLATLPPQQTANPLDFNPGLFPSGPGFLPTEDQGPKPPGKPAAKAPLPKFLVRLRELGVEERLRTLQRADPDPAVREAAATAAKAFAGLKDQQNQ